MRPKERQRIILERVAGEGEVSVEALSLAFNVSAETIRRDLTQLSEAGRVLKFHGGARRMRLQSETSFDERMAEAAEGKALIAAKLAGVIAHGDTCFIDTGTTTLACAQALAGVTGLTVITNSARIAQVLARGDGGAEVHLIGGLWSPDNGETVGPEALDQIARFRADHAIIGVAAVDATIGPMDADFQEAAVARAMCANARNIIIVAHAEKFGRQAAHRIRRLDEVDMIVCDEPPGDDFRAALNAARVTIH